MDGPLTRSCTGYKWSHGIVGLITAWSPNVPCYSISTPLGSMNMLLLPLHLCVLHCAEWNQHAAPVKGGPHSVWAHVAAVTIMWYFPFFNDNLCTGHISYSPCYQVVSDIKSSIIVFLKAPWDFWSQSLQGSKGIWVDEATVCFV